MSDMTAGFILGPAVFAAGLVVGSFLNVVILRGRKGETLGGRSHCDTCRIILKVRELIPIFSYIAQKGRCRSCAGSFSFQHPVVEFGTAIAFTTAAWAISFYAPAESAFLIACVVFPAIAALIVLIVSDVRFQILPDGAVAVLALCAFAASIIRVSLLEDLGAAFTIALFLAALWFFSRGTWMGFGDAKLVFGTSLAVGFPSSIAAFFAAFWLGGFFGLILLIAGKKNMQSRIPFGPFLIAGSLLAYVLAPPFFAYTGLFEFFDAGLSIFKSGGIL